MIDHTPSDLSTHPKRPTGPWKREPSTRFLLIQLLRLSNPLAGSSRSGDFFSTHSTRQRSTSFREFSSRTPFRVPRACLPKVFTAPSQPSSPQARILRVFHAEGPSTPTPWA
jgi:hypothetical protein